MGFSQHHALRLQRSARNGYCCLNTILAIFGFSLQSAYSDHAETFLLNSALFPRVLNTSKPNPPNQIYQTKPNLPNRAYQTKITKPSLPNQTYSTKPTKLILPNQTYQTKHAIANLPNQTKLSQLSLKNKQKLPVKAVDAWVRSAFGNVFKKL